MTPPVSPFAAFDVLRVIPDPADPDEQERGFGIVSQNYDQAFGRNHVAGNEGPQTAEQEARGGSESYSARLNRLRVASQLAELSSQHLLMLLQRVERTLLLWGQQLEQYLLSQQECQTLGLPVEEKPVLIALPGTALLIAWVHRHQTTLESMTLALNALVPFTQIAPDQRSLLEQKIGRVLLPLQQISQICASLMPESDGRSLPERGEGADFAAALEQLEASRSECGGLSVLLERYARFYQLYSGPHAGDGATEAIRMQK